MNKPDDPKAREQDLDAAEHAAAQRESELVARLERVAGDLTARREALQQRLLALGTSGLVSPQEVEQIGRAHVLTPVTR